MKLREAEKRLDGTVATCAAVPGRAPYVRSESWGRGDRMGWKKFLKRQWPSLSRFVGRKNKKQKNKTGIHESKKLCELTVNTRKPSIAMS